MKAHSMTMATVLAAGTLLCGDAEAQARNAAPRVPASRVERAESPPDLAARARIVAELESWLRRLVGRFEVKGTVTQALNDGSRATRGINGVMECVGIGEGPGVHCLIKASWPGISWLPIGGGGAGPTTSQVLNALNPAALLFALDREALQIQYLRVDDHGIADEWTGRLTGETADFTPVDSSCWGPMNLPHCSWSQQITAKPGSKIIVMVLAKFGEVTAELALHRLAEQR